MVLAALFMRVFCNEEGVNLPYPLRRRAIWMRDEGLMMRE
jgi:hypothetical protein